MDRPAQPSAQPPANLSEALDRLWARFLPEIEERVAVLTAAVSALAQDALTASEREAAHAAAHKLAGVLGTFGLKRGTELAREAEILFARDEIGGEDAARLRTIAGEIRIVVEGRGRAS